jgi:hypothetical protein
MTVLRFLGDFEGEKGKNLKNRMAKEWNFEPPSNFLNF